MTSVPLLSVVHKNGACQQWSPIVALIATVWIQLCINLLRPILFTVNIPKLMLFQLKIVYVKRTPKPRASFHTVAVVAVTVFIDRLLKRKTVVLLLCPPRAVLTIHSPLSVVFNYLWPQTLAAAHFVLPLKGNTPLWKVDLIANSTAISLLVIVAKTNLPCMNIRIMDVNLFELQFPLPNTLPLKTQLSMAVYAALLCLMLIFSQRTE